MLSIGYIIHEIRLAIFGILYGRPNDRVLLRAIVQHQDHRYGSISPHLIKIIKTLSTLTH